MSNLGSTAKTVNTVAFDLGASSGRLMLGQFDGEKLSLSEIHRFPNEPVKANGHIYWDTLRLFHEMKVGMKKLAAQHITVDSMGVDTWGVDYGLLDVDGNVIGNAINYRDSRTDGVMDAVNKKIPLREIFERTGIQFMGFNTIFQLCADYTMRPAVMERAAHLLFMPDLFNYFFTGVKLNEYTDLSTSQLLNLKDKRPDAYIMKKLGINERIFCEQVAPGTVIAALNGETSEETGLSGVKVVAVGSHDTASAVCGTPFRGGERAFLSCGTWSLLGIETDSPIVTEDSFKFNFTNEGGVENTIRFLKNINGLWIIQQLRKSYSENVQPISFGDIAAAARAVKDKSLAINPSDKSFLAPPDMMKAIAAYCENSGQGAVAGLGEMAIAVYNGLVAEYKANIENLEAITGRKLGSINMIGGGIQDEFLCGLTAERTGVKVTAGPIEASVCGNIVMQLKALGEIGSVAEGREIIGRSFEQKVYGEI